MMRHLARNKQFWENYWQIYRSHFLLSVYLMKT